MTPAFVHAQQDPPEGAQLRRSPRSSILLLLLVQNAHKTKHLQLLMEVGRILHQVLGEGSIDAGTATRLALHWLPLTDFLCPIFFSGFMVLSHSKLSITARRPVELWAENECQKGTVHALQKTTSCRHTPHVMSQEESSWLTYRYGPS